MRKRFCALFLILLIFTVYLPVSSLAESTEEIKARFTDFADIVPDEEEAEVIEVLNEISSATKMDVIVSTVNSLGGKSSLQYAEDWYFENGFGVGEDSDGVMLLIAMEARDWAIFTSGKAVAAVDIDAVADFIAGDLSEGNFKGAFIDYAKGCGSLLENYNEYLENSDVTEEYYPREDYQEERSFPVRYVLIPLVLAVAGGFIGAGSLKSQLKTVKPQTRADSYMDEKTFRLTRNTDMFLYQNIRRTPKPKNNSSSSDRSSSSGRTTGGSSGKF